MKTISDLFSSDPLGSFSKEVNKVEHRERFGGVLASAPDDRIIGALSPFVYEKPLRYWDRAQVIAALDLLESNADRSITAISARSTAIDRGLASLYRQSPSAMREESLDLNRPRDLIALSTVFMPDYLRWAEHVYSNLLELYWAILKKGNVDGAFRMKRALARMRQTGSDFLLEGYADDVRNAIAHGDFSISPFEIQFGTNQPMRMTAYEFLSLYDTLVRTCNALSIASLIFWSGHHDRSRANVDLPSTLLARLAAGGFDRQGLRLVGVVESNTPLAGKQLHVAIVLSLKKRTQVLGECARVAYHLLGIGAGGYDRYVIQVDQGEAVGSMVTVEPSKLQSLIEEDAPIEELSNAFSETNLLWFDEGSWMTRLKSWKEIVSSGVRRFRIDVLQRWHEGGIFLGKGRYRIREVERLSTQGIGRVRIRAVLKNPDHAKEPDIVRGVVSDIVSRFRRKLIRSRGQVLDPGLRLPKFPAYVWVDLFKEDGALRWLKSGGWASGNLVAVAEFNRGSNPPIVIQEPEELYKGIRIRYSMNEKRAAQAAADFEELLNEIWGLEGDSGET